jgi:hypothetical protein
MTMDGSPLRRHGIYVYDGVEYAAVHLSTDGRPWGSTALLHPPGGGAPRRILYLRHADGALLSADDFRPIDGTMADLIDTGRTDALD